MKNKIIAALAVCCFLALPAFLRADEARSPNTFVLLIGINKYPPEMTSLSYCVRDTEGLAASLQKIGVPAEQVIVMTDDAKEVTHRPSHANIMRQIDMITDLVTEDDQLIITFSGHGLQVDGKAYLCPNDTDLRKAATLIPRVWVFEKLEKCKAKRKLFIADACRDEVMVPGARSVAGAKSLADPTGDADSQGFVILASCSKNQKSWEDKDLGYGVFTYFVMQGLEGKADGNNDSRVTFEELYKYVMTNTRSHVLKTRQAAQVPMRGGEYSGDFVLASVPKITLPPVPVAPPVTPSASGARMTKLELPKPAAVPPIPAGRRVDVATGQQLLAAVKDYKDGDVIVLAKGTYSLSEQIETGYKKGAVTLYGDPENPANVKIRISGQYGSIQAGNGSHLKLIGLDISNGGYGVWPSSGSQADIRFCHVHDCKSNGISPSSFSSYATTRTVVEHCVIEGNDVSGIGGIYGELVADNCAIKNNRENGIYCEGKMTLTGCEIANNDEGGVVAKLSDTFVKMTGCKVQYNKRKAIWLYAGAGGEFRNNLLSGNTDGNWNIKEAGRVTRVGNTPNE